MTALALQQRAQTALDFDQLIQSRFADQAGWFCLGTIDGDPDLEKMKQEWYLLPRQRAELAERCAELAARNFNLYWAACLFGQRKRSYAAALPSPWLWQDDSPADMACTELIQSSEHKYQALVKLDRSITARERQRLQVAWRDATPGADSCSGNAVQLGRMPGGYNCKRHKRFLVTVASRTNKVWSADRLLAKAPALVEKACGVVTDLDWPAVEQWLGRAGALMDERDIPRRFKPHQQSYRVLNGDIIPCNSQGVADESTKRAFLARGCAWARYPHDVAAAILWTHTSSDYVSRKGTIWHKDDIARVIAKEYAIVAMQVADYKIRPITTAELSHSKQAAPAQPIVSRPAASRARADRPTKFDPPMLFARYQAEPALCDQRRKARAAALGISTATLDRLEDGLEAIGLIEIEARPGMPGRVILLGGVINIPAEGVLSAPIEAPPQNAPIEHAQSGENVDRAPQCKGETHPPPSPGGAGPWSAIWRAKDVDQPVMVLGVLGVGPDGGIYVSIEGSSTGIPLAEIEFLKPARVRRADLVAEAFDALDGCKRLTDKRIRQYIEMNYPEVSISPATLRLLATKERTARRYAKQDARELQKARALFGEALRKKSRAIAGAAAQMHRAGDKRAPIWDRRAGIYAQVEAERQQQEAERIQRIGYSLTEQAEMLDLVDQARPIRKQIGRAATSAGCVPPNPAPAGAIVAGVVERLHGLKAQRQQVQP